MQIDDTMIESVVIKRNIKGKEQIYRRRKKDLNFNVKKTFRLNDKEYEDFKNVCNKMGFKTNQVLRILMTNFVNDSQERIDDEPTNTDID